MTIQPFKLERYYTLYEFTADYLLCSSDCEALSIKVLNEKKVLLLPGDIYDYNGFFRIGFCRNNMPVALDKFEEFVVENLV